MLTISHSHAEGTLISGTDKGDGSAEVLKAQRWRWSRYLGSWFVPRSRDREANRSLIEATRAGLVEAGFDVEVSIDDEIRERAEIEADLEKRAARRANALQTKAQRREKQAEEAEERFDRARAALPPGGEPIKVGHHSEGRHRRAISRADAALSKSVQADRDAEKARRRAQVAERATPHRTSPATVANRIDTLGAEARRFERQELIARARGDKAESERQRGFLSRALNDLAYWQDVRKKQIAAGEATDFGPKSVDRGASVVVSGQVRRVLRVNKKTVTVEGAFGGTHRLPYHSIQKVISPQEREEALRKMNT